jgi:hypothetical protein
LSTCAGDARRVISSIVDLPAWFDKEQEKTNAGHCGYGKHREKKFHDPGSK